MAFEKISNMVFTIQQLCQFLDAKYFGLKKELDIKDISIDSRSLQNTNGIMFFALKGNYHDAHRFVPELIERGVSVFVVEEISETAPENIDFFLVKDSKKALQNFVKSYRKLFDIPVIGITGSNGKTIVKEWLNFLLTPYYNIIKSPKSYNSQVGVPLSVIGINEHHSLGIFEAGISLPNEMSSLEEVIQPSIGILTSIGSAHDEGFQNKNQKIEEKIQLFKNIHTLICPHKKSILSKIDKEIDIWSWSFRPKKDARVHFKIEDNLLIITTNETSFTVEIPFTDKASIKNIATCITTLLAMNIQTDVIQKQIPLLYKVEMRLQVLNGIQQCTIIDDSYSSDYQSLKIALDFLEQQKTHQQKTVILSDIHQSGFSDELLYEKVSHLLQQNKISKIIAIGPRISKHLSMNVQSHFFPDTDAFLNHFSLTSFQNETILIKGARNFCFEKIVSELEEKTHETILEINLDAITHNINFYKSKIAPSTKIMAMVKAFGYGNGSYEIAKHLAHLKIDYLGVAFADEGVALRKSGIQLPIIVMNPEKSAFLSMLAYRLEPEIYNLEMLQSFVSEAQKHNCYQYPIHIKLNTGMNRLGFKPNDLSSLCNYLKQTNIVRVDSIFSHLATSDMPEYRNFTLAQIQRFKEWSGEIINQLQYRPILHILNTSGVFHFPEKALDMVRLGIGIYGVGNSEEENVQLRNVSSLKTLILQINEISSGESVGYSRKYIADTPKKIATIPIGYADGIRRSYGNEIGSVWINGKLAKIVGNICMDMMMVDVTNMDATNGDEVVIFGENLRITEVAKLWKTIPYEVMTSISPRVKRVFYKE